MKFGIALLNPGVKFVYQAEEHVTRKNTLLEPMLMQVIGWL